MALRIHFDLFGDRTIASSRLRGFALADELRRLGHTVTTDGDAVANIHVFQKVRPFRRLAEARRGGARIVFDFDDHYLLSEVGTRDDVVAFASLCDVVTVGSPALEAEARRFHRCVALFDNPVDIAHGAAPRPARPFSGRVVWFGNRANLPALEALSLRTRVTTITAGGDIAWDADTVDGYLAACDLALIPVTGTAWNLAKNANRLLKSVALGLPALVSDTPEHRRVVGRLGLPAWTLIPDGGDWNEAIARAAREYDALAAAAGTARGEVLKHWGIHTVARRWLETVQVIAPSVGSWVSLPGTAERLAGTDVVILSLDGDATLEATLRSAGDWLPMARSITVVSPDPVGAAACAAAGNRARIEDSSREYFDVYRTLSRVMANLGGTHAVYLRAGAQVMPGFGAEILSVIDPASVTPALTAAASQADSGDMPVRPAFVPEAGEAMGQPWEPFACVVRLESLRAAGGLDPLMLGFGWWDVALTLLQTDPASVRSIGLPLVVERNHVAARTQVDSFYQHLQRARPGAALEVPRAREEWQRLRWTLTDRVFRKHGALFAATARTAVLAAQQQADLVPRAAGR